MIRAFVGRIILILQVLKSATFRIMSWCRPAGAVLRVPSSWRHLLAPSALFFTLFLTSREAIIAVVGRRYSHGGFA